jgi:hypothetical protein
MIYSRVVLHHEHDDVLYGRLGVCNAHERQQDGDNEVHLVQHKRGVVLRREGNELFRGEMRLF